MERLTPFPSTSHPSLLIGAGMMLFCDMITLKRAVMYQDPTAPLLTPCRISIYSGPRELSGLVVSDIQCVGSFGRKDFRYHSRGVIDLFIKFETWMIFIWSYVRENLIPPETHAETDR